MRQRLRLKLRIRCTGFIAAVSVLVTVSGMSHSKDESMPIVDVRFDANYRQIVTSQGDEWAPTWGRDDVLYTANDDGSSFGGIPSNAIAFGKLEGTEPAALRGVTINGMREYREPLHLGPESAAWKTLDSVRIGEALYRFEPCRVALDHSPSSCLKTSRDGGKTWVQSPSAVGGKPPFEGTKFSAPSFIGYNGRMMAWMGKTARDYAYAATYVGVIDDQDHYIIGRVLKTELPAADRTDWSFLQNDWSWQPHLATARVNLNAYNRGPDGANWKTMNTYSVNGVLYMFVTRAGHVWQHSSIIKSTDNGKSWTRSAEENFNQPMFPGKRFGAAYFVWYGKDGAADVDNADRYVYAISNNGYFANGDDYIIGRVPKKKLPNLSAADWSFYRKGDGMQDANWTPRLDEAQPVLTNVGRSSMTGMTYIPSLHRYVIVSWYYNQGSFEGAIKAKDFSTVLEFFEAPKPWGPWSKVKTFETKELGWYTPIIGQRFQTALNSGATQVYLYATGLTATPDGGQNLERYKLNYMPVTLSTKPLEKN